MTTTVAKRTRLLIRLSALGDIVLCSALVAKIQQKYAGDALIFITQKAFKDFVTRSFPQPLKVIGMDSAGWGIFIYFYYGFRLAALLKAQNRQDIEVYDLHGVAKSSAFIWGFRLKALLLGMRVSAFKSEKFSLRRNLSVFFGKDLLGRRHNFRAHLKALKSTEILSSDTPLLLATRPTPNSQRSFHLLVAPDSQHWKKRWILTYWEELLPRLLREHLELRVSLVGGSECLPEELTEDLSKEFGERVHNLLGQTAVEKLPEIAAGADLCLCGNSAWLHISEAVGTPVISLAGPIVPGFGFSPWRAESIEMGVELNCRPCSRHGGGLCKYVGSEFHACMKEIRPESVFEEVSKFILEVPKEKQ